MHLMLDFSYNLDSVFSHELCKSAFSDGIFWDSGVEPPATIKLNIDAPCSSIDVSVRDFSGIIEPNHVHKGSDLEKLHAEMESAIELLNQRRNS